MSLAVSIPAADLAALLSSRICHDLISPVGAMNNAIELFDEGGADDDAIDIIRMSAANASARLEFARIAFGAAGSAGSCLDTADVERVAKNLMANEKANLIWNSPDILLAKNQAKLLLNLMLTANAAIPRGGEIALSVKQQDKVTAFKIVVTGKILRLAPKFEQLYRGETPEEPIDAHTVQPYYTLLLSQLAAMPIVLEHKEDAIVLQATT